MKRSDVRGFYNYLAEERNVQINTIDGIHTVLHHVLELGVEDDYLRYNPSDNALKELKKARNFEVKKRRALTVPKQELFENFLGKQGKYHRWYPIFIIMLWTGMRVGEITGLRWSDIDLEEEIINVNYICLFDYLFISSQMSAKPYFIGSTGIFSFVVNLTYLGLSSYIFAIKRG